MTTSPKETNIPPKALPTAFSREGAIDLAVEQGVIVLRASKAVQTRIESLVLKNRTSKLTQAEKRELQQYEQIDDYLSLLNRLSRNLSQETQESVL